ncbi:MAG: hypothetical protein JNL80_16425 [Phycisphaerae bacterium]|jgi:putative methionine-R-sulfoxide reductase with GAF domain|nr:hypothetical protein [Phycisphaerae bacterium]
MNMAATGMTIGERKDDLIRRYRSAAEDTARLVKASTTGDPTSRMRAVADAVWTHFAHLGAQVGVSWVGFYLPQQTESGVELVLGPSRNKPACSPIGLHGVCGQSFRTKSIRIIRDVRDLGADYVACDPRDRSEIVLPVFLAVPAALQRPDRSTESGCFAVLDLDSHEVGRFTEVDAEGLAGVLKAAGFSVHGPG